jgi:Domain of unknown function (DUF4352)
MKTKYLMRSTSLGVAAFTFGALAWSGSALLKSKSYTSDVTSVLGTQKSETSVDSTLFNKSLNLAASIVSTDASPEAETKTVTVAVTLANSSDAAYNFVAGTDVFLTGSAGTTETLHPSPKTDASLQSGTLPASSKLSGNLVFEVPTSWTIYKLNFQPNNSPNTITIQL